MESAKGKSSTRSREAKRDQHPISHPPQKDAYARLLSQHQSIKFRSYLEQFSQPVSVTHDDETGLQRSAACSPGDKNRRTRGLPFTECADSSDTSPIRQNKKGKSAEKSIRQEQPLVDRKLNHENWRAAISNLDGIVDFDEGSQQGSKQKGEMLNHKGGLRRPQTDEDPALGTKCKAQQALENDAKAKRDLNKKKNKKKGVSKTNVENKLDDNTLGSVNDGLCEPNYKTPLKSQKPQGNAVLIQHYCFCVCLIFSDFCVLGGEFGRSILTLIF